MSPGPAPCFSAVGPLGLPFLAGPSVMSESGSLSSGGAGKHTGEAPDMGVCARDAADTQFANGAESGGGHLSPIPSAPTAAATSPAPVSAESRQSDQASFRDGGPSTAGKAWATSPAGLSSESPGGAAESTSAAMFWPFSSHTPPVARGDGHPSSSPWPDHQGPSAPRPVLRPPPLLPLSFPPSSLLLAPTVSFRFAAGQAETIVHASDPSQDDSASLPLQRDPNHRKAAARQDAMARATLPAASKVPCRRDRKRRYRACRAGSWRTARRVDPKSNLRVDAGRTCTGLSGHD